MPHLLHGNSARNCICHIARFVGRPRLQHQRRFSGNERSAECRSPACRIVSTWLSGDYAFARSGNEYGIGAEIREAALRVRVRRTLGNFKTHADYVGSIVRSVIDCSHDVEQIRASVAGKGLQWHDVRAGRHKMDKAYVMVPWPNSPGGPSKMLVVDWLRIATASIKKT